LLPLGKWYGGSKHREKNTQARGMGRGNKQDFQGSQKPTPSGGGLAVPGGRKKYLKKGKKPKNTTSEPRRVIIGEGVAKREKPQWGGSLKKRGFGSLSPRGPCQSETNKQTKRRNGVPKESPRGNRPCQTQGRQRWHERDQSTTFTPARKNQKLGKSTKRGVNLPLSASGQKPPPSRKNGS